MRALIALCLLLLLSGWACSDDDSPGDNKESGITLFDGSSCGPGNCGGCCTSSGACIVVSSTDNCGKSGGLCIKCKTGEACVNGVCMGSGSCDSTTCPTGCCEGGVCKPGTSTSACGTLGKTCTACQSTQVCSAGLCATAGSCGSSCTGCCSGTTCVAGTSTSACGTGGIACITCKTGETCSSGKCTGSSTCGSGTCSGCCQSGLCVSGTSTNACGTGGQTCTSCKTYQKCESGVCKIDQSSKWGITVVSATINQTKTDWDWFAYMEPDVFVELVIGTQKKASTTKDNTYTPTWNEELITATASEILTSGLKATVYDYDSITSNEVMGLCSISVTESALTSGSFYVTSCPDANGKKYVDKLSFKSVNK